MLRLWIDTSVAWDPKELRQLSKLALPRQVALIVHPQVYLERRRQKQVECAQKEDGQPFSSELFDNFLERFGYQVFDMHMSRTTAAEWADTLFHRYPTQEAWTAAKKATLGGELRKQFNVPPGRMPMTTDWLIALQIESDPQSFIITGDQKEEWRALREAQPRRAFSWDEALEWLQQLPD